MKPHKSTKESRIASINERIENATRARAGVVRDVAHQGWTEDLEWAFEDCSKVLQKLYLERTRVELELV